jgi:hypothetical protein
VRVANGGNITLESLTSDIILLLQDALGALGTGGQLGQLALFAAGFISSGRLFTGKTRTEYRSGGAMRIGAGADFATAAAVLGSEDSSYAQTAELVLRSGTTMSIAGRLPTGVVTTLKAQDGVFVSAAALADLGSANAGSVVKVLVDSPSLLETPATPFRQGGELAFLAASMPGPAADGGGVFSGDSTNPVLSLPGSLAVVPGVASKLSFAAHAFGAGAELLTVTLSVGAGNRVDASAGSGVTVSGPATARVFNGSALALSSYFAAGNISYTGASNALLTVEAAAADGNSSAATLQLYGAASASQSPPAFTQLASKVWITPATASPLLFGAVVLSAADPAEQLSLAFSVPAGSLSVDAGTGVTVDTAASSATVKGTAAALSAYLASAGGLRYTGSSTTLTLTLSSATGSTTAQVALAGVVQPATLSSAAQITLPANLLVTPGASANLVLASLGLASDSSAAVVTFSAAANTSLSWAAATGIGASSGATSLSGGSGTNLTLYGTSSALQAYLSAAGNLKLGASVAGTLSVSVLAGGITRRGVVAVTPQLAEGVTAAGPSLILPASYTVPTQGGEIRLPGNALGYSFVGSELLEVTLDAGSASLTLANAATWLPSGAASSGSVVKLRADASQFAGLQAWLATGQLGYSGSGATLKLSAALWSGAAQTGQTISGQTTVATVSASAQVLSASVPQTLLVKSGLATPLVFGAGTVTGTGTLTLVLSTASGALQADTMAGGLSDLDLADARSVRLSGTAQQINDYLSSAHLAWTGSQADSLGLKLSDASGSAAATAAQLVLATEGAAGYTPVQLSLPDQIKLTPGATAALLLGSAFIVGDASSTYKLTLSASTGALASVGGTITDSNAASTTVELSGTIAALLDHVNAGCIQFTGTAASALSLSLSLSAHPEHSVAGVLSLVVEAASTQTASATAIYGASSTHQDSVSFASLKTLEVVKGQSSALNLSNLLALQGIEGSDNTNPALTVVLSLSAGTMSWVSQAGLTFGDQQLSRQQRHGQPRRQHPAGDHCGAGQFGDRQHQLGHQHRHQRLGGARPAQPAGQRCEPRDLEHLRPGFRRCDDERGAGEPAGDLRCVDWAQRRRVRCRDTIIGWRLRPTPVGLHHTARNRQLQILAQGRRFGRILARHHRRRWRRFEIGCLRRLRCFGIFYRRGNRCCLGKGQVLPL